MSPHTHDAHLANHSSGLSFGEQHKQLSDYLGKTVGALNNAAKSYQLGVRFDVPVADDVMRMVGRVDTDGGFFGGAGERLFKEQVDTAMEVISRLVNGDQGNEHVVGLCQSGKNGVITCLNDFVGPIFLATRGRYVQPMVWLPNNRGMEQQSEGKFRQACLLNSNLRFEMPGAGFRSIHSYRDRLHLSMEHAIQELIKRDQLEPSTAQRLRREFGDFGRGGAFSFRRSKTKEPLFKMLARAALLEGIFPALIMDESHIAIGRRQAADNQLGAALECVTDDEESRRQAADAEATIESFYEALDDRRGLLVSVSATNTPFNLTCYEKDRRPVYLQIGPGYCGFPFVEGADFPTDHPIVEPEVIPIGELALRMQLPAAGRIDLRAFNSTTSFVESLAQRDWETVRVWLEEQGYVDLVVGSAKGINEVVRVLRRRFADDLTAVLAESELVALIGQAEAESYFLGRTAKSRKTTLRRLEVRHGERVTAALNGYRTECRDAFGRIWDWLLLTENPQNKEGGIVRWDVRNDTFNEFVGPLNEQYHGRLKFIGYMGEHATRSASDVIREQNPERLPYVLVVTGRGRFGESYPSECGYAFDATRKNSTVSSFTQSLMGRMAGYGKFDSANPTGTRPLIILSDNAYREVFTPWHTHKGAPPSVPMHSQVQYDGPGAGRPVQYCILERSRADATLLQMLEGLRPFVAEASQRDTRRAPAAKDIALDLYDTIEPYFEHIEANLCELNPDRYRVGARARILRRGETDTDGISYDWFDRKRNATTGHLKFQLRKFKREVQAGGLMSTRNMARTAENPDQRDTQRFWQIALEYGSDGQVDRIILPFSAPVVYPPRLIDGLRNREGNVPDRVGGRALTEEVAAVIV